MAIADPATCGDGEKEVDNGRHGSEQADLQAACAEACGIDVEKVDDGAAEHAVPGDVKIEVREVGTILLGDIGLSKQVETHGVIITIL